MKRDRLIFIPTYNEAGNVEAMWRALVDLKLDADILFMDDASPDGTGGILDRIRSADPSVHVIHRQSKLGIGTAHLEGIAWAYEHNYTILMTLDCDFTHRPEDLLKFLEGRESAEFLISSRYLSKAALAGWTLYRRLLTVVGHVLTTSLLGMPYDATTSFRLYRLDRIPRDLFNQVTSKGYSFFFESAYLLHVNGVVMKQVAVVLPPRSVGSSKMTLRDVWASLVQLSRLVRLRLRHRMQWAFNRNGVREPYRQTNP